MTHQEALFEYCLRLGDTSLILGQQLSGWCGHGPYLEEDIAMTNIALDLIGQARIILSYAGTVEAKGNDEDRLAFHRDAYQYRNLLLAEQPNGDFATTMTRHYLISLYQYHLYSALTGSNDGTISAFAAKSVKEVAYHLRHCTDWMLRLGDGTGESHKRLQAAVDDLWYFTEDLFDSDEVDSLLLAEGIAADMKQVGKLWMDGVKMTFSEAGLTTPVITTPMRRGSRKGNHTEHLGYILAEMQFLPRAYPDAKW